MDKSKFIRANLHVKVEPTNEGAFVIPTENSVYILVVDKRRKFAVLKDAVLKVLGTIQEFMAN